MQPLMYNLPFYKLFRTKRWIDYETHSDEVMRIGRQLFDQVDLIGLHSTDICFIWDVNP